VVILGCKAPSPSVIVPLASSLYGNTTPGTPPSRPNSNAKFRYFFVVGKALIQIIAEGSQEKRHLENFVFR
jgi:hypothetical protein